MRIHVGPVFALAQIQGKIVEELFSAYLPHSLGNSFRCEYMLRLYSHPCEYRENLANHLCIGFVRGGIQFVIAMLFAMKRCLELQRQG